jgi:ferredoxin
MTMSEKSLPVCIIGSGLSGVSAAKALLGRGKKVLMIDPGLDLPSEIDNRINQIGQKPAWQWTAQEQASLRAGVNSSAKGVEEKRLFGSNFASRGVNGFSIAKRNTAFYTSFATSGLGNIWGAGLLPMLSEDMKDWPVTIDELQPHYRSVLKFMPLSGRQDCLEKLFPMDELSSYHGPSRQASRMLAKMNKYADKLKQQGFFFGASRLAGCFHGRKQGHDCQYCGMCMYGCPYGIIYTSRETLEEMKNVPDFTFQPGMLAIGFSQSGDSVKIHVTDIHGSQMEPVQAQRILLACGPFATARIVLDSLKLYNTPLFLKTTDQYYLPLMSINGHPDIEHENLHTMCQAFWVLKKQNVSTYAVHTSIYTYNDLFTRAMQNMLGRLYHPLHPFVSSLLSRLYFSITYLHSEHSSSLEVRLCNDAKKTLLVEGKQNSASQTVFNSTRRKWMHMSRYTGIYPVPFYPGTPASGSRQSFRGQSADAQKSTRSPDRHPGQITRVG